jgi:hypothetical protein
VNRGGLSSGFSNYGHLTVTKYMAFRGQDIKLQIPRYRHFGVETTHAQGYALSPLV